MSNAGDSFIVSGNSAYLKPFLPFMMGIYGMVQEAVSNNGGSDRGIPPSVKGKIKVTVKFEGTIDNTNRFHTVEKSFRVMNIDPATVSLSRLQEIAEIVKAEFFNFSFKTGIYNYCLNMPEHGLPSSWGFYRDFENAELVLSKLCICAQTVLDLSRVTKSEVVEPGNRFQYPTAEVEQAGHLVHKVPERPLATVKFKKAVFKLPHLKDEYDLVTHGGVIIQSLDFLTALGTTKPGT